MLPSCWNLGTLARPKKPVSWGPERYSGCASSLPHIKEAILSSVDSSIIFVLTANAAITGDFTVSRFAHRIGRSPCAKRLTVKLSGSLPCYASRPTAFSLASASILRSSIGSIDFGFILAISDRVLVLATSLANK